MIRAMLRPGRNWQTGVVTGFAIAFALQWLGIVP